MLGGDQGKVQEMFHMSFWELANLVEDQGIHSWILSVSKSKRQEMLLMSFVQIV